MKPTLHLTCTQPGFTPFTRKRTGRRRSLCSGLLVGALCQLSVLYAPLAQAADVDMKTAAPVATPASTSTFETLAHNGVYLRALYVSEMAGNVSGGKKKGATVSHYGLVGMDVDLEKAFGWGGASIHSSIIAINSHGLNHDYIGGGIDTQENFSDISMFRFSSLTLKQTLSLRAKRDLTLEAGLMGVASFFGRSPYACEFMNHAFCGALWGVSQDTGSANPPLATWGARMQYNITHATYVQTGVFMSDKSLFDSHNQLLDFTKNRFTGKNWLFEVGHETSFADDTMPHYLRLGGWYLKAPRNDSYYNSAGQSYALNGGTRAIVNHGSGAYLSAGKVISRPDIHSPRNLAVFGSAIRSFNSAEPLAYTLKAGIIKTGTFVGRDRDAVMFGISDTRYSDSLNTYLTETRIKAGGREAVHQHEYTLELGYRYAMRNGVTLTPNMQYEINPTNRTFPSYPRNISNPLVIGVKLIIDFGAMAGMPSPENVK